MPWSRILVPIEFSPRCRGAAEYAEALASRFQSEVILLHVVSLPLSSYAAPESLTYPTTVDLAASTMVHRKRQLDGFPMNERKGLPVRRMVVQGDPARKIVAFAASEQCDLIVMPTHGYGPFRRFLLGSVTAKVLHDAPCPVWTGPHMENAPGHESIVFRKVLCALNIGPETRSVLEWAGRVAGDLGAELTIVHAIPSSTVRLEGVYFDAEWRLEVSRSIREAIANLQKDLALAAAVEVEVGDAPAAVSDVAKRTGADLIVIGRGPHGVVGRLRTNAYGIIRESPCPVLAS
jgi:nucleotide-binding universal stress UspA family protein